MGTTYHWIGNTGSYSDGTNWSPAGQPGYDDAATIDAPGVFVTANPASYFIIGDMATGSLLLNNAATLDVATAAPVIVGNNNGGIGSLTVQGGAHLVDNAGTNADAIGQLSGSSGTVAISGAGSSWRTSGRLVIGNLNGSSGTLSISSGGLVSTTGSGSNTNSSVSIGANSGSTGLISIDGPNSALSSTGRFLIGGSGTGTIEISNGGTVATSSPQIPGGYDAIFLGYNNGGSGLIVVSGPSSVLDAGGGEIGLGSANSATGPAASGTLVIENGATIAAGASVDIATYSAMNLGTSINSSGTLVLQGSGTTVNLIGQLSDGNRGVGSTSILNGATLSAGDPTRATSSGISIANTAGGSGRLLIDGVGTQVFDTGLFAIGRDGLGQVTVSGGATVTSTGNAAAGALSMSLATGTDGTGYETVTGAGSLVDLLAGFAVGGGADLSTSRTLVVRQGGTGSLTIANNGIVTVAGGATIFSTGTVSLAGGAFETDTLNIVGGGLSGSGTVTGAVTDGGVIVASGGTLAISGIVSGAGALAIAANSVLSLASGGSAGVAFQGAGGALVLGPAASLTGAVSGFAVGDTIDLAGTPNASASFAAGASTIGVLSAGAQTISLAGTYANLFFNNYADGAGGTDVVVSSVPGGQSGSLPNVSGATSGSVATLIESALAALLPAGATPAVATVSGGGFVPPSVPGTVNALVVSSAANGSTITTPAGFAVAYMLAGAATLQDTIGGAVLIDAAPGASLIGAAGDTLFGDNSGATLYATTGAETLIGGTGSNAFFLGGSTALVDSQGADIITGSSGAETVNASGSVLYFGTSGATTFNASGAGGDTLIGGDGGNTITGGGGAQLIFGSSTLNYTGGTGAATIIGGGAGNTVTGGSGNLLVFASGSMSYNGVGGAATVIGGGGPLNAALGSGGGVAYGSPGGGDALSTSSNNVSILVGGGNGDVLTATGSGADVLVAGGGAETINGSAATGNLVIFGGPGADMLSGGSGNDLFVAEPGNETLTGGGGVNSYVFINFGSTTRSDVITDFNPNTDAIGLFGYGAEPGADQSALASATVTGGNTVVTLTDGTSISFNGAPVLHSYNFF